MGEDETREAWVARAVREFEGPLCRYALRFTGDVERARDAVQETFLRLLKQDPAELNGRLAPWLFAVCRTRALDRQRKERRMSTLTREDTQASPNADPARAVERAEAQSAALRALLGLPPNQQEVIRLKFQEGMSYREISRVTQLSESNVGYLIHVGLRALRAQLAC